MKKIVSFLFVCIFLVALLLAVPSCKKQTEVHSRYEITAEYIPENSTLTGVAKVIFENRTSDELSILKFQLYPNAYRKNALYRPVSTAYEDTAYYNGESYGEMVISSVNGAKNWEVEGEDNNVLYAYLERSLFPEERVVLDVGFMIKLAQVEHRTGITRKTVNFGNALPILCAYQNGGFAETVYYSDGDPFVSNCADYKLTLKTPKEYQLVSTGDILSERTLESKKEYVVTASNVRDFAFVLCDKYNKAETVVNGKTIAYYYYQDENAKETLGIASEAFAYYEKTFGEYPYSSYTLAQTGLCLSGMEYPMLSLISDRLKKDEIARTVAHETAHQWWYAVVGNDQIRNAWQDEGLAEYSAITFFENYEKYGVERDAVVADALKEYRSYYDVYGSVLGRTDTQMTRHLKDFLSDYEYKCLSYDKAVVMFDTLRKSVGDKKFFAGLKKYYNENAFSIALPESMVGAFERVGLDVGGFFDSFLSGKAIL